MQKLKEILIGYHKAEDAKHAVGGIPLGETGLSVRMRKINAYSQAWADLQDTETLTLAYHHCREFIGMVFAGFWMKWTTEVLVIMDPPEGNRRVNGVKVKNLTVALASQEFQAEPTISQADKDKERQLYADLTAHATAQQLDILRNRLIFHADLEENLKPPQKQGDLWGITTKISHWYKHVAPIVYGGMEPNFFTVGGRQWGTSAVKELHDILALAEKDRRWAEFESGFSFQKPKANQGNSEPPP